MNRGGSPIRHQRQQVLAEQLVGWLVFLLFATQTFPQFRRESVSLPQTYRGNSRGQTSPGTLLLVGLHNVGNPNCFSGTTPCAIVPTLFQGSADGRDFSL